MKKVKAKVLVCGKSTQIKSIRFRRLWQNIFALIVYIKWREFHQRL